MKLIIATPSPYARKARVALLEKNISFETIVDNPWLPHTAITAINPLGKVPALVLDDDQVIHDSRVIIEYLDTLPYPPRLIPATPALRVAVKQIESIADGVCDAMVLCVLERSRRAEQQNAAWLARQQHKIHAGIAELARLLGQRLWFTDAGFSVADISTACALGYIDLRFPEFDWRPRHKNLAVFFETLSARPSFQATIPSAQTVPHTN